MPTFAHIENGYVVDPILTADLAEYKRRVPQSGITIITVPDGTLPNAKVNGGGYDPPTTPQQPVKPKDYSKAEFKAFCYAVLGAVAAPSGNAQQKLVAGISAFGALRRAASASADDAVFQALDEYNKADVFEKAKTVLFLGILNGTDPKICSDDQLAAIMANWENQ